MLHNGDVKAAVQDCNSLAAQKTPSVSHPTPDYYDSQTRSTIQVNFMLRSCVYMFETCIQDNQSV